MGCSSAEPQHDTVRRQQDLVGYTRDLHPWVQEHAWVQEHSWHRFFYPFPPLCHFQLFPKWQEGSTAVGKVTGAQWVSTATIKRRWHPKPDTAALSSAPRKADPEEGHSGGMLCSRPNNLACITASSQRGCVCGELAWGTPQLPAHLST